MSTDHTRFDQRRYPIVDVREGYGEWVRTYEQTVLDEMDLRLLARLRGVDWAAAGDVLDRLPQLPEMQEVHDPDRARGLAGHVIQDWNPEDAGQWKSGGRAIARRNLELAKEIAARDYEDLLVNERFINSLKVSASFVVLAVSIELVLGLALAFLLNSATLRRWRLSTIARDLSEVHAAQAQQRALEARLQEAHKMESIGTLAGGVAHDFNNVLAVILGNLAIAREDLGPGHEVQRPLALAHQAAARARGLVQQILAFSRRLPQQREVQPLAPLVEESLSLLRSTLPASATLEAQIEPEPLLVEVDAGQIQQVLLNLCTNALQALPAHVGRIRVEVARTAEGQARLSVIDDGSGMDEATRARIFDPFFTTKFTGRGLGLAAVLGIVRGHNGAIRVYSEQGRGTTFKLLFPAAVDQVTPDEEGTADAVDVHGRTGDDHAGEVRTHHRRRYRSGIRHRALLRASRRACERGGAPQWRASGRRCRRTQRDH